MKQYVLNLIIAVFCFANTAIAEEYRAFYLYHKDGTINVFFYNEVDSIVFSHLDVDSVAHEYFITQEIWTPDSVIRIPINSIDSIGFQTPPTIYKEGVIEINTELADYILDVDSLKILFSGDLPTNLRPHIGDKLVCTSMTSFFSNGFSGIVNNTYETDSFFIVDCSEAGIADMVEQYYAVRSFYVHDEDSLQASRRLKKIEGYFDDEIKLGDWQYDIGWSDFKGSIDFFHFGKESLADYERVSLGKASYSLNCNPEEIRFQGRIQPSIRINTALIINKETGLFFSISFNGKMRQQHTKKIKGSLDLSIDIPFKPLTNPWTSGAAYKIPLGDGFFIYFKPGISVGAEGNIDFEQTEEYESNTYFFWRYDSRFKENQIEPQLKTKNREILASSSKLSGSLMGHFGFFLEVGLTFVHENFTKLGWRGEAGVSVEFDATIDKSSNIPTDRNTSNYEKLAENKVVWKGYTRNSIELKFLWFPFSYPLPWNWANLEKVWKEKFFVPKFSELELNLNEKKQKIMSAKLSGDIFGSVPIGFRIYDGTKDTFKTRIYDVLYDNENTVTEYSIDFSDFVKPNHRYTAYPIVEWDDVTLLATPAKSLSLSITPYTDESDVINQESAMLYGHLEGSTEYLGNRDLYGFIIGTDPDPTLRGSRRDATMNTDGSYSLTIQQLEEGTTYYFCAFVNIDNEYYYGEIKSFETPKIPDDAVDLGLSVLWAKWNVGANSESEVGGLYGWADPTGTNTAYNVFNESGTTWVSSLYGGTTPPNNISGTSLDVASAKWGGDWRLPTETEMVELIDLCSWEWTVNNGTAGMTVTGPNGNSIFLPAGGDRFGTEQREYGEYGYYWTGTLNTEKTHNAYRLEFDDWGASCTSYARYIGHLVRPVMKKPQ